MRIPSQEGMGTAAPQVNAVAAPRRSTAGSDALARLSQIGADTAQVIESNRIEQQATSTTVSATNELRVYLNDMERDTDYDTQFQRYQDKVKDIVKRGEKQIDHQKAAATFRSNFGKYALTEGLTVRSSSLDGQLNNQRGELNTNMRKLSEIIGGTEDPERRAGLIKRGHDELVKAHASGIIDSIELSGEQAAFDKDMVLGDIRRDIRSSPDQAILKLQNSKYTGLSAEQQQIWTDRAIKQSESNTRRKLSEESRLEKADDKAEKSIQEAKSKEGDALLRAGKMTEQWIEENIDDLSKEGRRYFYRELDSDKPQNADIAVYTDLRIRASSGDVREEAREAVIRGTITKEQFNKVVSRSEKNAPEANLPNPYKRGEQFIGRALRVSDINPDPAATQRLSSALDDWTDWADRHGSATDEEYKNTYQRIVREYAFLNFKDFSIAKRMPRYAVGSRKDWDLDATILETVERFDAGEIDEDEFNEQTLLLQEWSEARQRFEQAETP